jgi:mannitol/fructose-specific phosphotransferase system IIA component (Ntr-type)
MQMSLKDTYTDLYFIDDNSRTKEEVFRKISEYTQRLLSINSESLYDILIKLNKHNTLDGVIIMDVCLSALGRPFAFIICRTTNSIDFGFPDSKSISCVLLHLNRDQKNLAQLKPMASLVSLIKNDEYRKRLLTTKSDSDIATLFRLFDIYKDEMKEKK